MIKALTNRYLLILLILHGARISFCQEAQIDTTAIFTVVETQPEFPGGYMALLQYVNKEKKYPKAARKKGIKGVVKVSFTIDKDGSVRDVKTVESLDAECDQEAERVIKSLPPWTPGMQNGKPVTVRYIMPVRFG